MKYFYSITLIVIYGWLSEKTFTDVFGLETFHIPSFHDNKSSAQFTQASKPKSYVSSPVEVHEYEFDYYSRGMWNATPPKKTTSLNSRVPYVTIHDSYDPKACYNFETCAEAMRTLQRIHMDENNWTDIGYSFVVGSDGAVYEGRGFETVPSHSKYFNSVSLGICLLGDWSKISPPENQLIATQAVIDKGVREGFIQPDYRLIGHRQIAENSECPGDKLFSEIKTWDHYSFFPAKIKDIIDVQGIPEDVKEDIRNSVPISRTMTKSTETDFITYLMEFLGQYEYISVAYYY